MMAQIIDLKNKQPGEEKTVEGEKIEQDQTKTSPRPEVLMAQSIHRRLAADTDEIAWIGPLSMHQPNTRNITVTAAIFFALAVLIQVFDGNLVTTVFFALLGGVILIHIGKEPKAGSIEINPVAVVIDNKLHRYNDIRSFWIEYDLGLGIKELSLQPKRWHAPYIKIPLTDQNPVQIRAYLLQFLPEEEHKDTLADVLARKLGI